MTTTELGIDSNGTWTAHQYLIDAGYDRYSIEQTAECGVSEAEIDGLSQEQIEALESHCRSECQVCGKTIQHDRSGVGHCWRNVYDLSGDLREEIAAEILGGGKETCDSYRATNGLYYRW